MMVDKKGIDRQGIYWLVFIVTIFVVKLAVFYLDHVPMFFLGDSMSYLSTATKGWIPPDRSFVYGFLIRYITEPFHSLTPLILAQVAASALSAIVVAFLLWRFLRLSLLLAFLFGLLCAMDPLQLLLERYVMTETFCLMLFAIYLLAVCFYLEKFRIRYLLLLQIIGVVLIAFRLNFLAIVAFNTILLPILYFICNRKSSGSLVADLFSSNWKSSALLLFFLHLLISITIMQTLHYGYRHLNGYLSGKPPAYQYDSGFMVLAAWSPVVKAADFPRPELADKVFLSLKYELTNRRNRAQQHWYDGGLTSNIKNVAVDHYEAERFAKQTAINALIRDPLGIVKQTLLSYCDYWNFRVLKNRMHWDRGERALPSGFLQELNTNYGLEAANNPTMKTFTNEYFFIFWPWMLVLFCTPFLAVITLFTPKNVRRYSVVVSCALLLLTATVYSFNVQVTPRLFQAVGWLSFLLFGQLVGVLASFEMKKGLLWQKPKEASS